MRSPRHGTENMYKRHKCRCEECVEAFRAAARDRRARARARGIPDYAHGTTSGYTYWGCRCPVCSNAFRRIHGPKEKAYRERNREKILAQAAEYRRRKKEQQAAEEAARRARLLKRGA